jgi:hypothetical protein
LIVILNTAIWAVAKRLKEHINMGNNRTPDAVRGFILPFNFTANNYWAAQSNATQGTSRAGVADPVVPSSLQVITKGTQTQAIDIQTQTAGHIGNAKFGWKYATDTDYYGNQVPSVVTDVTAIAPLSLAGRFYLVRDALTLDDGTIITAVEYTTATANTIRVYKTTIDGTTTYAVLDSVDIATLGGNKRYPALCLLPDGSIICAHWVIDDTTDTAQIQTHRSINNGGDWDLISSRALPTDINVSTATTGYKLNYLTMAAGNGQILLFASLDYNLTTSPNRNAVIQYASVSQATTFNYVGAADLTSSNAFYLPHAVYHNGVYLISWVHSQDTIKITRLTDAYTNMFDFILLNAPATLSGLFANLASNKLQDGQKSMHKTPNGRVYLYVRHPNSLQIQGGYTDLQGIAANDYGEDWHLFGTDTTSFTNAPVLETGAQGSIQNFVFTGGQGDQICLCNWQPNGSQPYAYSVLALRFGVWATKQYPSLVKYPMDNQWAGNTLDWVPCDLPTQNGVWAASTIGSPSITLEADRLALLCGGSEAIEYRKAITDKTNNILLHCKLDNISGGTGSRGAVVSIQVQPRTSTTTTYYARIYFTQAGIFLRDGHTGNLLDSATGLNVDGFALLALLDNDSGNLSVYYSDINGPRQYGLLSDRLTAATGTTQQITWGVDITTVGASAEYAFIGFGEGSRIGLANLDGNNGLLYPAWGYYEPLQNGLYITTKDGPARQTDQWEVLPQYDYPIEKMLYELYPSRQMFWRSDAVANPDTTDVPNAQISWALDADHPSTDQHITNNVMGIHLANINFRTIKLQRYTGGVWYTIATATNQVGPSFDFVRHGNGILVDSHANGPYLHYNECAGWYMHLDDGAGNVVVRKIRSNSEGVLNDTTTTKHVAFELQDLNGTEPLTGTAALIPSSCTILCHDMADIATHDVAALRLNISGQRTLEGYFKIGYMHAGPVVIPATQYGRGRTIAWEADIQTTALPSGVQYARVMGAGGRVVRISWQDGVDISELYEASPDPDYYTTKPGSEPEAIIGSAPTNMFGIVQYLAGSVKPVVYLPNIDTTSTDDIDIINRYHDHVMATVGPDVQIENVLGDESQGIGRGEVLRVGTVVMREVR